MKKLICILLAVFYISVANAEFSLSLGHTYGKYLETITNDGQNHLKQSIYAGRPAIFFELDSMNHPLWLDNDNVVFGIGAFAETRHHDYYRSEDMVTHIPFYGTYYLKLFENWSIGAGINFDIMQLRYRNRIAMLGQQIGKQLMLRKTNNESFCEVGIMQNCANVAYPSEDISIFYDVTNYVFRYGWYLDKNNY